MNVCTFYSPFQNDVTGKYQKTTKKIAVQKSIFFEYAKNVS